MRRVHPELRARQLRDDSASIYHLFEAVLVMVMLIWAVVFVVQLGERPDTSDTSRAWEGLRQAGEDALGSWYERPPWDANRKNENRELGANTLERLVRERFTDPETAREGWDAVRRIYFPDPGVRVQLELDIFNRWSTLYGEEYGAPLGENVGVSRYVLPAWNAVHAHAKADPADGVTPLMLEVLPVNKSVVVRQPGEVVRFTARYGGELGSGTISSGTETRVHGLVAQRGGGEATTANLIWITIASYDAALRGEASATVGAGDLVGPKEFELRVDPRSADLSAGVTLTVRLDHGFVDVTPGTNADWSLVSQANHSDGRAEFTVRLERAIDASQSETVDFEFQATPLPRVNPLTGIPSTDPPTFAFARVHAFLGEGALSRTTAIVRFGYVDGDASTPRQMFPTLPYALQPGATARVGVVFQNGARNTTLRELVIDVPGDYDFGRGHRGEMAAGLFDPDGAFTPLNPDAASAGAVSCEAARTGDSYVRVESPRLIRWCGVREVGKFESTTFLFEVTVREVPTSTHNRTHSTLAGTAFDYALQEYWGASLEFADNGYTAWALDGPGAWRDAPGISRFRVPAASAGAASADGYPHAGGGGGNIGGGNEFTAAVEWPRKPFEGPTGGASYRTATSVPGLGSVEGAVMNSTLEPAKRRLLPGDVLRVSVDFEAVVRELSYLVNPVTNLKHTLEVFVPASLPGQPFLTFEESLDDVRDAPVAALASANVIAASVDDEILMASGDGRVYAVSALSGVPDPPLAAHWNEEASSGSHADAVAVLGGDVDPTTGAVPEVLALGADGRVAVIGGAIGTTSWTGQSGLSGIAATFDPEVDDDAGVPGTNGRVYALGYGGLGVGTSVYIWKGRGDYVASAVASTQEATTGGLAAFRASADAADRAVLVALPDGVVRAFDPDGGMLWSATSALGGAVLAAAATEFSHHANDAEEVIVVWDEGAAVFDGADGALVAEWGTGTRTPLTLASAHASVRGTSAADVAVADEDGLVRLLDFDRDPLPTGDEAVAWSTLLDSSLVESAGPLNPEPLGEPDAPECANLDLDPAVPEPPEWGDAESLYYDVCTVDLGAVYAAGDVITPTALRVMADDSGSGAPIVLVGGHHGNEGHVLALDAADGSADRWPAFSLSEDVRHTPTAFSPVTRATGEPFVVIGDDGGRLYLRRWSDGASEWGHNVQPGANAGEFTYYVAIPEGALPGAHVLVATLQWDQVIASGNVVRQHARVMNWVEVMWPDDSAIEGDFTLPVVLRVWRGEWDVCLVNPDLDGDGECDEPQ